MTNIHPSLEALQAHLDAANPTTASHLEQCSICRTRMEALEQLVVQLNQLPPQPLSFDLETVAMHAVVQHEMKKRKTENLLYWSLLAVAAGALAFFALPVASHLVARMAASSFFSILLASGTALALVAALCADMIRQYKGKEKIIETI